MDFTGISNLSYYLEIIKRVIPVGFEDCDPAWWYKMP
jgi:hypothetical protein